MPFNFNNDNIIFIPNSSYYSISTNAVRQEVKTAITEDKDLQLKKGIRDFVFERRNAFEKIKSSLDFAIHLMRA